MGFGRQAWKEVRLKGGNRLCRKFLASIFRHKPKFVPMINERIKTYSCHVMKKKFSRQELYELAWSKSMLALSKEYNISDVGLRKMCRRMEIPVPLLGHWQKVEHGKTPNKKILSANYSGQMEVTLELREPGSGGTTGFQSQLTILHNQILSDPSLPLSVPDRLSAKDELIADVKLDLTSKQYRPRNGIITSATGNLDITVSPKNLSRALRFMAALVKLLKVRGHKIKIENHETFVIVEGQDIQLILKEKSSIIYGGGRRVLARWLYASDRNSFLTDETKLSLDGSKRWKGST